MKGMVHRPLLKVLGLLALALACHPGGNPAVAAAATSGNAEVAELQRELEQLERRVEKVDSRTAGLGGLAFLFGVVCALWAQNSGRSPWLWFILGAIFSVIASVVMLWKNAQDRDSRAGPRPGPGAHNDDEPVTIRPPVR